MYLDNLKKSKVKIEIRKVVPWWQEYTEVDENGVSYNTNNPIITPMRPDMTQEKLDDLLRVNLNQFTVFEPVDEEPSPDLPEDNQENPP